jgi:tetratricopeptide (TPR) repeat protein
MKYDRLGFPIPPAFDGPVTVASAERPAPAFDSGGSRPRLPGTGKRLVILLLLAAAVLPALLAPVVMPALRAEVVAWSMKRATDQQANGRIPEAIANLDRAIRWTADKHSVLPELLCWRANLRIENRDAAGAAVDADRAVALDPTGSTPRRVRALVNVVLQDADAALADADATVEISGRRNPEALNYRAYIRALVGRDLEAGLTDIEAVLASGEDLPEFLDTRGYLLHLLGRHQEAIDDLNRAIDESHRRRRMMLLVRRDEPDRMVAQQLRSVDRDLAVMHHHRGLACRAVGLEQQARQDLDIATRKGFDPSRGIF